MAQMPAERIRIMDKVRAVEVKRGDFLSVRQEKDVQQLATLAIATGFQVLRTDGANCWSEERIWSEPG